MTLRSSDSQEVTSLVCCECNRLRVRPITFYVSLNGPPLSNILSGLLARRTCETNETDLGNVPYGVCGYLQTLADFLPPVGEVNTSRIRIQMMGKIK